ncbi:MAG: NUDIX domain-containing protein [Anaerolineales bacterium]|nr:NUDIX domain-containing protein [Anaerolineales bacterium]
MRHTYQDHWFLVGGGLKRRETLDQAARRETLEEVGATLDNLYLFGIYTNFHLGRSDNIAVFVCKDFSYTGEHDREIESVQFFPLDALPDDIAPGNRRRIEEYRNTTPVKNHFGVW